MIFLGIYPGWDGAIAYIDPAGGSNVFKCPETIALMSGLLNGINTMFYHSCTCVIEKPHSILTKNNQIKKLNVLDNFNLGENSGAWKAILSTLSIPYYETEPKEWQLRILGYPLSNEKNHASIIKSKQLFPNFAHLFERNQNYSRALFLAKYCSVLKF